MAAMVTSTKTVTKKSTGPGGKMPGPNGNGSKRDGMSDRDSRVSRYRLGMWVALASVLMLFTALSSAYVVRSASANDWVPLVMPRVLLLSTALIMVSSATLEAARRKLKTGIANDYGKWLLVTVVLGFGFLASQLMAWRQLVGQGIFLKSNPHSSFFYLLTAIHGLHLLVGLLALTFLVIRSRYAENVAKAGRRLAATEAMSIYWHFMDALWIYLFLLLFLWR